MSLLIGLVLVCTLGFAGADDSTSSVTDRNVSVAAFIDAGQVMHGSYVDDDGGSPPKDLHGDFMNRDGVALTYSGTLNGSCI